MAEVNRNTVKQYITRKMHENHFNLSIQNSLRQIGLTDTGGR